MSIDKKGQGQEQAEEQAKTDRPASDSTELGEEQLDKVAGGARKKASSPTAPEPQM